MTASEATTSRVQAGDISLHYTRVGGGSRPLVWLHGSGPGANGMSNFGQNLASFDDFANIVFDLPRYGESDRPTIDGPLADYSGARVAAALDALEIGPSVLIGNSFGGSVATWIAGHRPELVDRLVLMAPGGVRPPGLRVPEDLPSGLKLISAYMSNGPDEARMREIVEEMLYDPKLVTDELVARRYEASKREPEIDTSRGRVNLGDVRPLLAQIQCPTMLIWGREDRFVPLEWAWDFVNTIEDAELHVLPHCGHWVQYERQTDFDELAGRFIRG